MEEKISCIMNSLPEIIVNNKIITFLDERSCGKMQK